MSRPIIGLQVSHGISATRAILRPEDDYVAWINAQATVLRERRFDDIDYANLPEEFDDLGRSVKREIASRMNVLLHHLLTWQYQPAGRSRSWKGSVVEQRNAILDLIDENPSLQRFPATIVERQHGSARLKAEGETGLPESVFPEACPFTVAHIPDPQFYPEGRWAARHD